MSRPANNPYTAPVRPAFAPLQTANSQTSSYSSTSSLASQTSTSSAPLNSPTASRSQHSFGSMDQQVQPQSQQQYRQQPTAPQRHPSFEYRPNRDGAGTTAAETTNYLNQMALLNEAAKRAQMAVVIRDLDGMEL